MMPEMKKKSEKSQIARVSHAEHDKISSFSLSPFSTLAFYHIFSWIIQLCYAHTKMRIFSNSFNDFSSRFIEMCNFAVFIINELLPTSLIAPKEEKKDVNRDSHIASSPILQSSFFKGVRCLILASSQRKFRGYIEFL